MGSHAPNDVIDSVELEAQVVMRIAKHCRQQAPLQVSGRLLGLDVDTTLHATSCFAYKAKQDDVEENVDETAQFHHDMLRSLREVNVDANTIGWYCSTYMGNFITDSFIDAQLATQKAIPKSVVIVYDPLQAAVGTSAFKAYRLDLEQLKGRDMPDYKLDVQTVVMSEQFLKEVPITIRCSPLVELFFHQYVKAQVQDQFDTLNLDNGPFMENSMRYLIDSLDEFQSEQQRMQLFERQNRPGKQQRFSQNVPQRMGAPRPADQMLIAKQITSHCGHIEKYAGDSFSKLFLVSRDK